MNFPTVGQLKAYFILSQLIIQKYKIVLNYIPAVGALSFIIESPKAVIISIKTSYIFTYHGKSDILPFNGCGNIFPHFPMAEREPLKFKDVYFISLQLPAYMCVVY